MAPSVTRTDGTAYDPSAPVPGTSRNPVGRLTLTANVTGSSVSALTISTNGAGEGIEEVSLWTSASATFDAAAASRQDQQTLDPEAAIPATITFNGLSHSVPTDGTYLYVVADLTADAAGDVQFSLASASDLTITDGTVSNSSSDFPMPLSSGSQPLPVELSAFDAQANGEAVALTWQTAAEQSNAGFEVQRRSNSAWETLTFVEGAGTTSAPQSYRFRDAAPPFADVLVYRLKQIDTDGSAAFSPEVVVRRGPGSEVQLAAPFPNPTRQQATVRYVVPGGPAQPVRLDVYNVLGQRVGTLVDETQAPGREELTLDASGWASGVYFLRLQVGETMRSQRVTVVR
ncbi:T9SS type A sorting domain-containing protein [Salisaeta longa]|uniref:T9SS type A sorting domain-containing protein n=1 Tax=Salisaeta longa TaxID=503170 RepID=UPI0003B387C5|nr:T9SS type A sorting domain-containing protein [Salisaeta longa]